MSDEGEEESSSRKRSRSTVDELDLLPAAAAAPIAEESVSPTPLDFTKMSRSERKKHHPDVKAEAEERAIKGQWKGVSKEGGADESMLSRVDLISRTVEILRRVHRENEERKQIIATLMRGPASGLNLAGRQSGPMMSGVEPYSSLLGGARQENPSLRAMAAAAAGNPFLGSGLLDQAVRAQQFRSGQDRLQVPISGGLSSLSGPSGVTGSASSDLLGLFAASSRTGLDALDPRAHSRHAFPPMGAPENDPRLLAAGQLTTRQYLELLQSRQQQLQQERNSSPSGGESASQARRGTKSPE